MVMLNVPSNAKPHPPGKQTTPLMKSNDDWGHTALGVDKGPSLQPLLIVPIASLELHKASYM